MDTQAVLQANKNLSTKITKLEKEVKDNWLLKEKVQDQGRLIAELERRLQIKRSVVKVIVQQKQANYVLMLTKVLDTEEGLYIEGVI